MSKCIYELLIRFQGHDQSASRHLKDAVCAWLQRKGRTDFVEGIVDGVVDELTAKEHRQASVDEARIQAAPIAVYDRDRTVLQGYADTLHKKFNEQLLCIIHDLPDAAWNESWNEEFSPWQTKRFMIVPKGRGEDNPLNLDFIEIDAREGAFGTGQHTTTRCLLKMMEVYWRDWQPRRVLDVGAGTGILSIAAAKLGATVVATEIDSKLVSLIQENAVQNKVKMKVLDTAHPVDVGERFDLVIANILVPVLHDLMPELQECCVIGGRLLISGFIAKEAAPILAKAALFGFEQESTADEGGWNGIALRRIR